jgi:hydrogenase nickel incorporation protein HypA/HybF
VHELGITQNVVDAVTERTGSAPVATVRLRVGRLAGVVPDAMRFCFDLVTAGTPLEGAALEIEQPEGRGRCRACGSAFVLADVVLLCDCGSADVEVLAGRELSVVSVVLADQRPVPDAGRA